MHAEKEKVSFALEKLLVEKRLKTSLVPRSFRIRKSNVNTATVGPGDEAWLTPCSRIADQTTFTLYRISHVVTTSKFSYASGLAHKNYFKNYMADLNENLFNETGILH